MKKNLIFPITLLIALFLTLRFQSATAQVLPFWNLNGNSNATANSKFGTTNNIPLRFFTNNQERIRITPTGFVGIGTNSPAYKLHVNGNAFFSNGAAIGDGGISIVNNTGDGITSYGNVGGARSRGNTYGMWAEGNIYGVYTSSTAYGVFSTGNHAIYGTGNLSGAWGHTEGGYYGVLGTSNTYNGVYGFGVTNGVYGVVNGASDALQPTRAGVYGTNNNYGAGVYGHCFNGPGILGSSVNYYAGYFTGNVYSTGNYIASDNKLKTNVDDFSNALDIINQLQPKIYNYRQDGRFRSMNLPDGKHYGLISENVRQVLPNLVKDTRFDAQITSAEKHEQTLTAPDGKISVAKPPLPYKAAARSAEETIYFKAVNYTELIPIMIKGMQEQQQQIQQLKQQVEELKNLVTKFASYQVKTVVSATLGQNTPNPVNKSASIQYSLPSGNNTAQLLVTDDSGRTVKAVKLSSSGIVNLDVSVLSSGIYNYSLVIDGKIVETKKMVVIRN